VTPAPINHHDLPRVVPTLRVYFDYGSPYAYLAWQRIMHVHPERYRGVDVQWIPASAGHLFKRDGSKSNVTMPNQKRHLLDDVTRWAEVYGVPFAPPPDGSPGEMPVYSVDALRLHFVVADQGADPARVWMDTVFHAYFRDGRDISDRAVLASLLDQAGLDASVSDVERTEVKTRLVTTTDAAYRAGAPGVPFMVYEDEGYWGNDRLSWIEARITGNAVKGV
jgi:2-hydroxychromene-2-carboxylate isomerase